MSIPRMLNLNYWSVMFFYSFGAIPVSFPPFYAIDIFLDRNNCLLRVLCRVMSCTFSLSSAAVI